MSGKGRAVIGGVGIGVLLACAAAVVVNWDSAEAAWDRQVKSASATLFRVGELGSIAHQFEKTHGFRPETSYVSDGERRVLGVALPGPPPAETGVEEHAREMALFALSQTTWHDRIDDVSVSVPVAAGDEVVTHAWPLRELLPGEPSDESEIDAS
ncbi:MAG: hypothetical protein AAF533_09630 [Acidobacteriota bacterium]